MITSCSFRQADNCPSRRCKIVPHWRKHVDQCLGGQRVGSPLPTPPSGNLCPQVAEAIAEPYCFEVKSLSTCLTAASPPSTRSCPKSIPYYFTHDGLVSGVSQRSSPTSCGSHIIFEHNPECSCASSLNGQISLLFRHTQIHQWPNSQDGTFCNPPKDDVIRNVCFAAP